jgi:hypothetical protein
MRRYLRRLVAWLRWSGSAICEESADGRDYHDWPDSIQAYPWHFTIHKCWRCGKEFTL